MTELAHPLSNTQLEILKAFSANLSEEELIEFKNMIAQYFASRAIKSADKIWDEKKWSDKDVDIMLSTKMRKRKSS